MARRRNQPIQTTPQARLSSAIKSGRDIMRKDAGLSGDLDRVPQLAQLFREDLFKAACAGGEELHFLPATNSHSAVPYAR